MRELRLQSACALAQSDKSLCCLHEETASLANQNVPSEVSDQTANAYADLNLRWAQVSEGTFSDFRTHVIT